MWSSVDGRYLEHHAVDEDEQERSRPGPIKIEEQSSSIYPSPDCLWNSRESQTGAVVHDADCDFPPLGFDMPRGVAYHSPHYLKREEECDRSIDSPSTVSIYDTLSSPTTQLELRSLRGVHPSLVLSPITWSTLLAFTSRSGPHFLVLCTRSHTLVVTPLTAFENFLLAYREPSSFLHSPGTAHLKYTTTHHSSHDGDCC